MTLRPIKGLPAQPVELHLLGSREARNPALRTVFDTVSRSTD